MTKEVFRLVFSAKTACFRKKDGLCKQKPSDEYSLDFPRVRAQGVIFSLRRSFSRLL